MVLSTRGRCNDEPHCFSAWTKNFYSRVYPLRSIAGKEREKPQKDFGNPLPNKPEKKYSVKPDIDNYLTRQKPGVNKSEKTDHTRIDEPPPAKP